VLSVGDRGLVAEVGVGALAPGGAKGSVAEADLRVELSARRTAENVDLSVMDLNEAASEPQLTNVQVRK